MPYNCIVLAKQVPDTKNITGDAMTPEGTVNRAALPAIFNPEDLNALEMALQIKESFGGTVTVITMGLPFAAEIVRQSLYRGADRGILLTDIRLARSDTLATSYALSRAIETVGNYDMVICGRQAIDGDTAQVGPQVAEKLSIPQITYVEEIIELKDGAIKVRREIENGQEVVESRLPILLTVTGTANNPRYPSAKRLMKYKAALAPSEIRSKLEKEGIPKEQIEERSKEIEKQLSERGLLIEEWNIERINAEPSRCGGKGSPTIVRKIESVVLTGSEMKKVEPTEEAIRELIHELIKEHTLE